MLFMFPGDISPSNFEAELQPFFDLVRREGLDRVSQLQISFLGWRGGERCQIVNKENFISEVSFDQREGGGERVVRPGVIIRDRPADLEYNPLAHLFGHDD